MKEYLQPEAFFRHFAEDVILSSPADSQDNSGSYNDWEDGPFGGLI